jgi:hypothetical protein
VSWEFAGLHDLREVLEAELGDGVEVFNTLKRGAPEALVRSKEQLQAFWVEANKDKTALELLGG